ncbi:LysR substrate-binding domain-containing protein [Marinobacterium arenosum]|uniref:LysR substrate-binding domain-containing protein n=1 Tax=Marinobacterium arenosum TaxID=2862496 RepID=UPI001C9487A8|nr:LysR substrate-binding domain-containing protein [Marinobacterium arenosum]MBY4678465.1 LysR family transcriptional regulator [Marinobacterium arenosum]
MSARTPPLRSLHTFAVAARHGSFKHAADQLYVTPQAVSLQIKALEEQLGFALFERKPAGIALSAAGEQLLDYVERGIGLIERGIHDVQQRQQRRQLRISASPWFAVNCLLPEIGAFEQTHPDVDLLVSTSVRFPDFQQQRLDLAIQWGFGQWPFSRKQLLLTDDKLLVCAPSLLQGGKPLSKPEHLTGHRLLCTELSVELWRQLLNTLGVDALVERQVLPLDSHAGLVEAAVKGLGVALISVDEARQACREGRLVAPLGDQPISSLNPVLMPGYWLVVRDGAEREPLIGEFLDWMGGWLRQHPRATRVNLSEA